MTDPAATIPSPDDDAASAIADLRERILATKEAAERLHAQSEEARAAASDGSTPPSGWATPEDRGARADEVHALAELVRALRELVPDELRGQVTEVLRQLLLLVRAIIDWWVDRLELETPAGPRAAAAGAPPVPRVEDIPIGS
ncbi:hypothetical protein [Patulibacter sp.]|uniref:hypothetical protein n=1 Tax=Patulibacter sp. TaxID=1912859 RepID=UPI00271EB52C|nr:hypothetical protein [Patulibacter sp.]MDO9410701.1 hypothetical protein [Patulibacter sp.]